jgi:hypothetical protein
MEVPRSRRVLALKGLFLFYLVSYNPLETSKVKLMGIFIFHNMCALPVVFLCSLIEKIDLL